MPPHAAPACFLDDGRLPDTVLQSEETTPLPQHTTTPAAGPASLTLTDVSAVGLPTRAESPAPSLGSAGGSSCMGSVSFPGSMSFFSAPPRLCVCHNMEWIRAAYGSLPSKQQQQQGDDEERQAVLLCLSAIPTLMFGLPHAKMCFDHVSLRRLLVVLRSDGC
ncbi:hypothetical protein DQ04_11781010 [Trypanosoma grayi]|uniref:hypothetical protein n=1 Tax=Trypanosoma grayi TaxID=71804 RepID=UPI0004F4569E|nr:hypothetical protein DQ04_11781010 [Trypanosoma grayi]KEG06884.1 hypothetical protein DQ04_11781010 [Trypanosoma grayi]